MYSLYLIYLVTVGVNFAKCLCFLGIMAHIAPDFKQVLKQLRQQCGKVGDKASKEEGLASLVAVVIPSTGLVVDLLPPSANKKKHKRRDKPSKSS